MRARLSLMGLYNYDNTILDGLRVPDNFADGSLDAIKQNLLYETMEFEVLYPNPDFLKSAITQWCNREYKKWEWLRNTQLYDYNPIWNADYRISDDNLETRDLAGTLDVTNTGNREAEVTQNINETHKRTGEDTTTNQVYAYNDTSTGANRDKSITDYNNTLADSGRDVTSTTDGVTNTTDQDTTDTGTIKTDYERWLRGNYGVKTTQAMIKEEQELAMFNLLEFIIEEFKKRFCILVY